MLNTFESLFYVFVISPLLLYMGISIYFKNEVSKWIAIITFILIGFILIHHLFKFVLLTKKYRETKTLSKEIGIFYILLSFALFIFNIFLLLKK